MHETTTLPIPSNRHATCAWCRTEFASIIDLIDHVEAGHADATGQEEPPHAAPAADQAGRGRRDHQRRASLRSARRGDLGRAAPIARRHLGEFPDDAPMLEDLGASAAQWGDDAWLVFTTLVADLVHEAIVGDAQSDGHTVSR